MNNVSISGRVLRKGLYKKSEESGKFEFRFYISSYTPSCDKVQRFPCYCEGWLADEAFSKICENCYVEVVGNLEVSTNGRVYVHCNSLVTKKPRSKREFYIRTTDFLQYYKPENVLERLEDGKKKKKN